MKISLYVISLGETNAPHDRADGRIGFTLIELLIVVTIIAYLAAILLPTMGLIRKKSQTQKTLTVTNQLVSAFELYRNEDPRNRYPQESNDLGASSSISQELLNELDDRRMGPGMGLLRFDSAHRLVDEWQQPIRYSLNRPTPTAGKDRLKQWNYNLEQGEPARMGFLPTASGAPSVTKAPLPYPYFWSIGDGGSGDDTTEWIFTRDGYAMAYYTLRQLDDQRLGGRFLMRTCTLSGSGLGLAACGLVHPQTKISYSETVRMAFEWANVCPDRA